MADSDEGRLLVEFEDTGETIDNATEFSIQSNFMVDCDAWSLTVASENNPASLRRKFQVGRPIKLYLGDRLQLIGRIGTTQGSRGGSGALTVSGRDYLADLVDPDIDPTVRITAKMSLADALIEGLRVFGITEVESSLEAVTSARMGKVRYERQIVFDEVEISGSEEPTDEVTFTERTVAVAEPLPEAKPSKDGEGALQWAKRLAALSGFTIQPGSKRNSIAVVAPDYTSAARYTLTRPGIIRDASATRNGDDIPTYINLRARLVDPKQQAKGGFEGFSVAGDDSPSALRNTQEGRRFIEASQMVDRRLKHGETNALPALYKPIYHQDQKAKTKDQVLRSGRALMAEKTSQFFTYNATIYGHTDYATGAGYAINTLAKVTDAVEDVNDTLWIYETEISFGASGKETQLSMLLPGTYVL